LCTHELMCSLCRHRRSHSLWPILRNGATTAVNCGRDFRSTTRRVSYAGKSDTSVAHAMEKNRRSFDRWVDALVAVVCVSTLRARASTHTSQNTRASSARRQADAHFRSGRAMSVAIFTGASIRSAVLDRPNGSLTVVCTRRRWRRWCAACVVAALVSANKQKQCANLQRTVRTSVRHRCRQIRAARAAIGIGRSPHRTTRAHVESKSVIYVFDRFPDESCARVR
jgi:hypothetical protein